MRGPALLAGLLALGLGACAGGSNIDVLGTAPLGAGSYRIAGLGEDREPTAVERMVGERLAARGFSPATDGAARYSVHVAYSARSGRTRTYLPSEAKATAAPAAWLMGEPQRLHLDNVYSLVVQVVDAATGEEAYRVAAAKRAPEGQSEIVAPQLVAAAFGH